jgi:hypothetical protein
MSPRAIVLLVTLALPLVPACGGASEAPVAPGPAGATAIAIPESMRVEHAAIHEALVAAGRTPGQVGAAARDLAQVLHPHFVREEQVALPPLGLLAPLARGEPAAGMCGVLRMTDALRAELPTMLEQHRAIAAAGGRLAETARAALDAPAAEFAARLKLHAQNEEEVLYPAAILVGDLVRARVESEGGRCP